MKIDHILATLNLHRVDFLLVGGMNYLLRHGPELTFDVDVWIRDEAANKARLNAALCELGAEWGPTEREQDWKPVPGDPSWLDRQPVFCLTTPHGALDVFRELRGLEGRYDECSRDAGMSQTATGTPYRGMSDHHMLDSQLALDPSDRKPDRIATLQKALGRK